MGEGNSKNKATFSPNQVYMQHIMVGQSEHLDGLSLSLLNVINLPKPK